MLTTGFGVFTYMLFSIYFGLHLALCTFLLYFSVTSGHSLILISFTPVSYTHLDVYKRQGLYYLHSCSTETVLLKHVDISIIMADKYIIFSMSRFKFLVDCFSTVNISRQAVFSYIVLLK